MNPVDASPADWRMYYHNTWMIHKTHGPCHVSVEYDEEDGGSFFRINNGTKTFNRINSNHLMLWFPPVGAYNVGSNAVYLGRRAQRMMRKSAAYPDTYYVQWGGRPNATTLLKALIAPVYHTCEDAINKLRQGEARSLAISRHIILWVHNGRINVVYKGHEVATAPKDSKKFTLSALLPVPRDRLAAALRKEGIRC